MGVDPVDDDDDQPVDLEMLSKQAAEGDQLAHWALTVGVDMSVPIEEGTGEQLL
jgi:hypothetical protein